MEGKTIAESVAIHKMDKENKRTGDTGNASTPGKVSVTMKDTSGKAFMMHVDPTDISMPMPNAEFAGITSDTIPDHFSPATPIKSVEYEGWFAFEEELRMTVDWNTHMKLSGIATLSEISPIHEKNPTPVSVDNLPFYVNTGTTVHISPEKSDFLML